MQPPHPYVARAAIRGGFAGRNPQGGRSPTFLCAAGHLQLVAGYFISPSTTAWYSGRARRDENATLAPPAGGQVSWCLTQSETSSKFDSGRRAEYT